jgi:sigma-B regulation protein RsbU (phosphoserine phosphatase)
MINTTNFSDITVLFVDDEADTLSSLNRLLRKESYRKLYADNATVALELLACNHVAVVISDYNMPGMNGLELLKIVKTRYPEIIPLLISGHNNMEQITDSGNSDSIFRFIAKPVEPETLKKSINEAIHYYRQETGER